MFCLSRLKERRFSRDRARRTRNIGAASLSGDFARSTTLRRWCDCRVLRLTGSEPAKSNVDFAAALLHCDASAHRFPETKLRPVASCNVRAYMNRSYKGG